MRSERASGALRDIVHHIDLATRFIEGLDRATFKADLRAVYAVTRCLEIISEASRRLPNDLKARHPDTPASHGGRWQRRGKSNPTILKTSPPNFCGAPCGRLCPPFAQASKRK